MALLEAPPGGSSPAPEPEPRRVDAVVGRRSVPLLVAGTVLTLLAITSLWSWRSFASSQGFADVATDMLRDAAVREVISDQIVTILEEQDQTAKLAVSAGPLLDGVVASMVATDAFQGVFHAGAREMHAAVVRGARSTLLVDVPDAAQMVKDSLEVAQPALTTVVPDTALEMAVGVSQNTPVDTLIRVASLCGWLAAPLALAAALCFGAAILRAADRRRAVEAVGWCLIALGAFLWALLHVLGSLASRAGDTPLQGDALRALFWSMTNLLSIQCTIVITIGAVLAVAGAYAGTTNLRTRGHLLWQALWERLEQPGWKALASVALIVVALVAMMWPAGTAAVLVRVLAFGAFVAGAVGLLDLVGSRRWSASTVGSTKVSTRRLALGSSGLCLATCALLFFGGLAFIRAVRAPTAKHQSIAVTGCNGHQELCDRRIDQVVFAGTHNSMSASNEPGWWFANQSQGLLTQLARGVRALMLDVHYGSRIEEVVRTDLARAPRSGPELTPLQDATVKRVLGLAGMSSSDSEPFLCHNRCELGAIRAVDAFARIHDFLREKPNEVVLIILQDEVAAADLVKVLERSRLANRAYTWEPGSPLPTLRQMIEQRRNVVIVAERGGGAKPWYHAAYGPTGLFQETPYEFESPDDFSCVEGRGSQGSPLFLMNHWITQEQPDPTLADDVNAAAVLQARAEQCHEERGKVPNVLAVDFHDRGDLFEVVDELNDVGPDREQFQAGTQQPPR